MPPNGTYVYHHPVLLPSSTVDTTTYSSARVLNQLIPLIPVSQTTPHVYSQCHCATVPQCQYGLYREPFAIPNT